MRRILIITVLIYLGGCTVVDVKEVDASHSIDHVCIEENPKVKALDFLGTVEDVFHEHSITTEIYLGDFPQHCKFKLTYTAAWSWDFASYLSYAELQLFNRSERIGYARYQLRGGGVFALNKWAGVESKMAPVVNHLLAQY